MDLISKLKNLEAFHKINKKNKELMIRLEVSKLQFFGDIHSNFPYLFMPAAISQT